MLSLAVGYELQCCYGSRRRRQHTVLCSWETENHDAVAFLARETPQFSGPELWPPNSPDYESCGLQSLGCHAGKSVSYANTRHRRFEATADWHVV